MKLKGVDWTTFTDGLNEDQAAKFINLAKQIEEKYDNTEDNAVALFLPIMCKIIIDNINIEINVDELIKIIKNTQYIIDLIENNFLYIDSEAEYCQLIKNLYIQNIEEKNYSNLKHK
jgi:hypothetical protein